MLLLGIDDAGRGPVIGPMVLAGVLIDEKTETILKKEGVKDSKKLTQKRREFLEIMIKEKAITFEVEVAFPAEIDIMCNEGKLNDLEAEMCAKIINRINKNFNQIKVVVDCPSVNIGKWRDFLKTKIGDLSNLEVLCEHKADQNHVSVSAASIIAKCLREKEMDKLKEKYGKEIGSGYCSDPVTQKFLERNGKKYEDDGIFRQSWATWKDAINARSQKKLGF